MGIIDLIEGSALAEFVRSSPSIFGYTSVLALHAMGLAIVVGVGAAIAFRLLGFPAGIPAAPCLKLFRLMWVGFTVNALSGFALLAASASTTLANTMFLIKMLLIVFAVANMELLRGRLRAVAQAEAAAAVGSVTPPASGRALAISALVLWATVIIAGRLTAYPNFVAGLFGS